jgi:hypothetical protein
VKKAEFYWFKRAQTEIFQDPKGRKSLENLNPMKDEDGLLRIDGRLRHADISYESSDFIQRTPYHGTYTKSGS